MLLCCLAGDILSLVHGAGTIFVVAICDEFDKRSRGGRGDRDRLAKSSGIDVRRCVTAHRSLQQLII